MALQTPVALVDRQQWLDPVADRMQKGILAVWEAAGAAGRRAKNFLHGVWLGHPLHPVLTDVPIGAWTVTLALDAMDSIGGRARFARGADAALTLGLVGAVGAAATGVTDWGHTDGRARRIGLMHGMLNSTAAVLYLTSLVLRRRGARAEGQGFAMLGFGVSMAAAYLGGNLVYDNRVGVNHAEEPRAPGDFIPVLADGELAEGQMRRVDAGGVSVLVARRGGAVFAVAEVCSHMGGPLAEGRLEGDTVRCPWHGSRFSLEDGHVVDGPATFPQPCFDTRIRAGRIEVRAARH
jgi:nitrite reductase/ring-hydroxylating ferredoxin subunit